MSQGATTPAGKLQMHILGAIAEFERARIAERVKAGLQREAPTDALTRVAGALKTALVETLARVPSYQAQRLASCGR